MSDIYTNSESDGRISTLCVCVCVHVHVCACVSYTFSKLCPYNVHNLLVTTIVGGKVTMYASTLASMFAFFIVPFDYLAVRGILIIGLASIETISFILQTLQR